MKTLFLGMILIAGPARSLAPRPLTIAEAIALGRENNRQLAIADARLDAASGKAGEARSALLPAVRLESSYKRLSDVPPFQVTLPLPQANGPITISPTVLNNYNLKASVQQPLFTGFKLSSNARAADELAEASGFDRRSDEDDLLLNVTTAYWTLYQTAQTRKYADENVVRLQTYRRDTENLLTSGLATRNDLLKVEVQLSSAILAQIDAANDAQVACMNLDNLIGLPLHEEVLAVSEPGSEPDSSAAAPAGADSLFAQALGSRPDLQATERRLDAAKSGLTAARGNWWPQLFLTGAYYYNRPNSRYQPTLDAFRSTWEVGVQLQMDVWNWGATASQAQQAEASVTQTALQVDQMKDNIALDVRRSSLAVAQARQKVAVARLAVDEADENLRTTGDKYKNGVSTSTDLLDANVALLQAKTNYTAALVELAVAHARLDRAVGKQGYER